MNLLNLAQLKREHGVPGVPAWVLSLRGICCAP